MIKMESFEEIDEDYNPDYEKLQGKSKKSKLSETE